MLAALLLNYIPVKPGGYIKRKKKPALPPPVIETDEDTDLIDETFEEPYEQPLILPEPIPPPVEVAPIWSPRITVQAQVQAIRLQRDQGLITEEDEEEALLLILMNI